MLLIRISLLCQKSYTDDDYDRTDDIGYRDRFAEQDCRNEHRENKGCALEEIRRTDFDSPEYLLPKNSKNPDDSHCAAEPQKIPPRKRILHCRHFRADPDTRIQHVDTD